MNRSSFYSGLAAGVGATLPLPKILASLGRADLARNADGKPLSEILAGAVPAVDVEVVRAAEVTGKLEQALEDLAERAREEEDLRRQLTAAVIYPVIVLHAAVIVPWVFAWILFDASPLALVLNLAGMWGVLLGVRALIASAAGEALPVVGGICRLLSLARLCETLAAAVQAALPLRRAIELAAAAAGGATRRQAQAAAASELGRPLVETLAAVLPPLDLELLRVGEESGSIDRSLRKIAENHRAEARHRLNKIKAVLPVVLFLIVAGIAAAVIFAIGIPDMAHRGRISRARPAPDRYFPSAPRTNCRVRCGS